MGSSIIGSGSSTSAPPPQQPTGSNKIPILFGAVAALLAACIYLFYQLSVIRSDVQTQLSDARDQMMAEIAKEHETTSVSTQTSKKSVDKLKEEVDEARKQASQLAGQAKIDADKHTDELTAKLEAAQEQQAKQVSGLTSDVNNVKDAESNTQKNVGEVKTQVGQVTNQVSTLATQQTATQAQLEKTVADLKSTVGDLGVQSGLIATNAKELGALRQLGERNYTDFRLAKGKKPEKVGDVEILLESVDAKKNKYSIKLIADDKQLEKKDKELNEPVQFYLSRASQPYELVVNQINKDMIVGYVSAPKVQQSRKQ
jgi:septal ring factor EnvC (AmiA/AmiB activator)